MNEQTPRRKPPGKRSKAVFPTHSDERKQLQERVNKLKTNRAKMTHMLRMPTDLYAFYVDVAEQTHAQSLSAVILQALDEWRVRYGDTRYSRAEAPPIQPQLRATGVFIDPIKERYPGQARDVYAATTQPLEAQFDDEDAELQAHLRRQAVANDLAAPLPTGGMLLVPVDEPEIPPLTQEEAAFINAPHVRYAPVPPPNPATPADDDADV